MLISKIITHDDSSINVKEASDFVLIWIENHDGTKMSQIALSNDETYELISGLHYILTQRAINVQKPPDKNEESKGLRTDYIVNDLTTYQARTDLEISHDRLAHARANAEYHGGVLWVEFDSNNVAHLVVKPK